MLYKPALSLLALGLLLTPAQAVQAQPEEELAPGFAMCMKEAYSTMAMVECLQQAYEYWDGELNRNYKAIMSVYAKSPDLAETRKNLQKAQRAWIGYRDSTAKYFGGRTGGSEDSLTSADFVTSETKRQALFLKSLLDMEQGAAN